MAVIPADDAGVDAKQLAKIVGFWGCKSHAKQKKGGGRKKKQERETPH